ncbi:MAG: Maf family protein [Actinomycetota bacterium]
MGRLILASTSPQRRAILQELGADFEVVAPAYVEVPLPGTAAEVVVARALGKARAVAALRPERPVVGVDTEVVLADDAVLGQPADAAAAVAMLRRLAGREHRVLSGVAVIGAGEATACVETQVRLRALTDAELADYVATGEWRGRAGGYAIQAGGGGLVASIDGDLDNVIGLPVAALRALLAAEGQLLPVAGGNPATT